MRAALIQMRVAAGEVAVNRARGLRMIEEAAAQAELIVMPEIWTTGYALRQVEELAETEDGPTVAGIAAIASRHGVTVVAGSLPLRHSDKIYNKSLVIGPNGIIAAYEKLHLFSMSGEERFFAAGEKRCVFQLTGLKAGLAICYELRFPELFRSLSLDGAKVIFLPGQWPTARAEHWDTLTKARAIENQVYICAVNCVGEHRGNSFYGHSRIIGPAGELVAEGGDGEEIVYGDICSQTVDEAREKMKVWRDRRPEVYYD